MPTRRIRIVALTTALAVLALDLVGTAPVGADARPPVAIPSRTDASAAPRTARPFTVTGQDLTVPDRFDLAPSDRGGALIYETRSVTASPASSVAAEPFGHQTAFRNGSGRGGTLRQAFADLCAAMAMLRVDDLAPVAWSNWPTVEPGCMADVLAVDVGLR